MHAGFVEVPAGVPCFQEHPPDLVEAAGQMLHPFRNGLDYAFILSAVRRCRMRGVLSEPKPES